MNKSPAIILCLCVWSASLIGAYYYGSSKQETQKQAEVLPVTAEKKEKTIPIEAAKGSLEAENADSQLTAYLEGGAVSLREALQLSLIHI